MTLLRSNRWFSFVFVTLLLVTSSVVIAQSKSKTTKKLKTPIVNKGNDRLMVAANVTINKPDDGYRGIWYFIGKANNEYKYKYSGGLGTYCDVHYPQAIYSPEVKKTFFCYGGSLPNDSQRLIHMVSYFDHQTGMVPRPTILLDKQTGDAHDNPIISIDRDGFIWIFSTSHGLSRPSFVHKSKKPFDVTEFDMVQATHKENESDVALNNFSYMQMFHHKDLGFASFFTKYNAPASRTSFFMTSSDGVHWSEFKRLAAIDKGHYQVGYAKDGKVAVMFNMHPEAFRGDPKKKGLDYRTNLYYMESVDGGVTWQSAAGTKLDLPLTEIKNPALVFDLQSQSLLDYVKDLQFDAQGRPVIMYLTSKGHEAGPENAPRTLRLAYWNGKSWDDHPITTTDHNYDSLTIYLEAENLWRAIGPTDPGPQPFGTGGEMVMWISTDKGVTWKKERQLTNSSQLNHSYARRALNAHPDFYAIWADGNSRKPSKSSIYFCNQKGDVFKLPTKMTEEMEKPALVRNDVLSTTKE